MTDVASEFVFSLMPVVLAYNLAHCISLLILQGQLIIPLISAPFGFGWNILGTADDQLNLNAINARDVGHISVYAILVGHTVSVYVPHVNSLSRDARPRERADKSVPDDCADGFLHRHEPVDHRTADCAAM